MREEFLLLDYPSRKKERAQRILEELNKLGVELLRFSGKGYRGVVFKGKYNGETVAVKVKRTDISKEKLLERECEILKYLEEFSKKVKEKNPAPKLYHCTDEYIVMEFIEGIPFSKAIENYEPKSVIREALRSCYFLDKAKVKHSEIKGEKHLIFDGKRVRIIDFESAKYSERPRNLLQFVGYHLMRREELLKKIGMKKERLRILVNVYKTNPERGFKAFMEELKEGEFSSPS